MTKRILVPTESIPAEAGAIRWAADEAIRSEAEFLLLRVIEANGNGTGEHAHARAVADTELTVVAQKIAGPRARGLTVEASDSADLTQLCVSTGIRLPASLAFIGKALGQVQLATAQLEPGLDPFAVAGRFFTRRLTTEMRDMVGPERFVYNARKLRLRFTSLIESLERLSGARPGWEPKLVLGGTERLEDTIRKTGRRLASAFVSGAAFLVCGLTAAVGHVAAWVPSVFGAVGGVFALFLLVDVLRR